jgi:hypothetical protein
MTTQIKRKKPTKKEILDELVPLRIKQMEQENKEAMEKHLEMVGELTDKLRTHLRANFESYIDKVEADYGGWRVSLGWTLNGLDRDDEGHMPLPEEVRGIVKAIKDHDSNPHGHWSMREHEVRKKLSKELSEASAPSVIASTKTEEQEKMPVMHEYLTEFLATLNRVNKAKERLVS